MQSSEFAKNLTRSLERQRRIIEGSLVLTPVDSIPLFYDNSGVTKFLHGLYVSDKQKVPQERKESKIQFGGRDHATRDQSRIQTYLAELLGGEAASLRMLSGLHAYIVMFMSLGGVGQKVLLIPESAGGHFAVTGIIERLGMHVISMPVDKKRFCIDALQTLKLIDCEKPDFILIDRSEGLRFEDFSFLRESNGIKIFDASHYLPQIILDQYENPFSWGFDLSVFTLHKSFPGPQKAGVVARKKDEKWTTLLNGLGNFVSSFHIESSYLAALCLSQKELLTTYCERALETATELELALLANGLPVFCRGKQGEDHWPNTHHIWIPIGTQDEAFGFYKQLAKCRIQTNYRFLPYELGWGIRMGTSATAMCGLTTDHIVELSEIITSIYSHGFQLKTRHQVRRLSNEIRTNAITKWPLRE